MDQSYPKESWKICNTMLYNGLEFLDQSYPRKIGKFVRIFRESTVDQSNPRRI